MEIWSIGIERVQCSVRLLVSYIFKTASGSGKRKTSNHILKQEYIMYAQLTVGFHEVIIVRGKVWSRKLQITPSQRTGTRDRVTPAYPHTILIMLSSNNTKK